MMASVLWIPAIILGATVYLYILSKNMPSLSEDESALLKFPYSLEELQALSSLFARYRHSHEGYIYLLFSSAYIYKQTFSIPGSFFLNVLAGALFGPWLGVPIVCLLTGVGSSFCYILVKSFAKEYVQKYFSEKLSYLQQKVEENKDSLFYFLLFMRTFPMTPNWLLNIMFPIVNVPLYLSFLSIFLGLLPYNFICVQTGGILSQISSLDDVLSWSVILKLLCVALVTVSPGLYVKWKGNSSKMNKTH